MDMQLKHKNKAVQLTGAELLGEGHIDYGSPRSFRVKIFQGFTPWSDGLVYVIQKTGLTKVEGEHDRHTCSIAPTAKDAIEALFSLKRDRTGTFMPRAARVALEQAAAEAPELMVAMNEREES